MTTLFKLEGGGNWKLNNQTVPGSYYIKDVRFIDMVWEVGILDPATKQLIIPIQPVTEYVKQNGQPYLTIEEFNRVTDEFFSEVIFRRSLKYTAFITQEGTEDPIANILQDDIGDLVWAREDVGIYTLTKSSEFPLGRTVPYRDNYVDNDGNFIKLETMSPTEMRITTSNENEELEDGILYNQYFNLEIFI